VHQTDQIPVKVGDWNLYRMARALVENPMNRPGWLATTGSYLDKHPKIAWAVAALWILLLGSLIFIWNLGNVGLVDETEPLFAEAARQMIVRNDWITPYFNEDTRFDKPPLVYWLMAIAYKIVGVNEWGARLPSALSAIALMGMLFYILKRYSPTLRDRVTPWFAAALGTAIYALHPLTIVWGRTGVSDMLLTSCMSIALLCFFYGYANQDPVANTPEKKRFSLALPTRAYLLSYLFIVLAVLTKGPVGIVLPGLIIGAFLIYTGRFWEVWREMRPILGIGLILVLTLPWYLLVTWANGEKFIDSFFGYHNVERFTSVVNNHSAPWYFYFLVVAVGFVPWSTFLPLAIAHTQFWKRSITRRQPRSEQLGLFAVFWFAGVFLFFTVAVTKLPSYVLPLMPAAAILVALLWQAAQTPDFSKRGLRFSGVVNSLVFIGGAIALPMVPHLVENDPLMPKLTEILEGSSIVEHGVTILGFTAIAILGLLILKRSEWLWLPNLVGFFALFSLVLMPSLFILDAQRQEPLRQLSQAMVQAQRPGENLIMVGTEKPSVVFYTQRPIKFLRHERRIARYIAKQSIQPESVLVLGSDKALSPKRFTQPVIAKSGSYRLIRIEKKDYDKLPKRSNKPS